MSGKRRITLTVSPLRATQSAHPCYLVARSAQRRCVTNQMTQPPWILARSDATAWPIECTERKLLNCVGQFHRRK